MIPPEAVAEDYELGIGKLIVETFATRDFIHTPVVIVAGHGPFAWDKSALAAVQNAASLEEVARMACLTLGID
jgi:L-ribulose-5-phosphate 4-epimerase